MKYLYQQMLAFWVIIVTILIIIGISFTQFTKRTIENSTFNQLEGYAESIRENGLDKIAYYEKVLESQDVRILYLNNDKLIVYPEHFANRKFEGLTADDWKKLSEGQPVNQMLKIKNEAQDVAITAVPTFRWIVKNNNKVSTEFNGIIVAYQPISSIQSSMQSLTENMFKAFLISSVVAVIISYFLAKFQVNRIDRMRSATKQIANGNFDVYIENKEKDELDDLADDFNQMANSLKESQQEIERQEERRKQFMADAAHEMRTPLTTINGLLEGLAYNAIPEDQKQKGIELMQNETKRLIRLVNENLDYEKIRTNQISIMVQRFDATETLKRLVQQLQSKAQESGDELVLLTEEPVEIFADYDRFMQVVVNITQNAIQFTNNGKITLSVEKGYLETIVKISDTGMGMTKEEVQNIWDRYYKADPSRRNTKYGESGLGLSIVHQLVKLHHGKIQVSSEKGVGTTFVITFPDVDMSEQNKISKNTTN